MVSFTIIFPLSKPVRTSVPNWMMFICKNTCLMHIWSCIWHGCHKFKCLKVLVEQYRPCLASFFSHIFMARCKLGMLEELSEAPDQQPLSPLTVFLHCFGSSYWDDMSVYLPIVCGFNGTLSFLYNLWTDVPV